MRAETTSPIEPLCDVVEGRYEDDLVVVGRRGAALPRRTRGSVRTPHFDVVTHDHRLVVTHDVPVEEIDDDLAGIIVGELFGPGWVRGAEMYERIFTGIVRTSAAEALDSWELFYRNTIRRLEALEAPGAIGGRAPGIRAAGPGSGAPGVAGTLDVTGVPAATGVSAASGVSAATGVSGHGSIADYAPVYDRAVELVPRGSVLELGSCFGFLALRLAAAGHVTTASDVSAGTVRLLASVAPRLGVALDTLLADAARVPVADGFADTVAVIHLLEHLEPDHGEKVLAEAVRCAVRRVVIAVPLEVEADESYGHLRTISLEDLRAWGRASGLPHEVSEHHGGWLVLDKV